MANGTIDFSPSLTILKVHSLAFLALPLIPLLSVLITKEEKFSTSVFVGRFVSDSSIPWNNVAFMDVVVWNQLSQSLQTMASP